MFLVPATVVQVDSLFDDRLTLVTFIDVSTGGVSVPTFVTTMVLLAPAEHAVL